MPATKNILASLLIAATGSAACGDAGGPAMDAGNPTPDGGNNGNCTLPVNDTYNLEQEAANALGIKAIRWNSGPRVETITAELIGADDVRIGTYTLERGANSISYLAPLDGETAVVAGPVASSLVLASGDRVDAVMTSRASHGFGGNFNRPDPDNPATTIKDVAAAWVTVELRRGGRSLFIDELVVNAEDRVRRRRMRVVKEEGASIPTNGKEISLFESDEGDEPGVGRWVQFFALELQANGAPATDELTQAAWLTDVGLGEWNDAEVLSIFLYVRSSPWQFDLYHDVIECIEGDVSADDFEVQYGRTRSALSVAACGGAVLNFGLIAVPIPILGLAGKLISGASLFDSIDTVSSLILECVCTNNAREEICLRCVPSQCNQHCKAEEIPPGCSTSNVEAVTGSCDSGKIWNGVKSDSICVCTTVFKEYEEGCVLGDPHVITWDNRIYSPQVVGEFVYAETTNDDSIMLQVRQEVWPNAVCQGISIATAMATRLDSHKVFVDGKIGELRIDDEPHDLDVGDAFAFGDGSFVERLEPGTYILGYPSGAYASVRSGLAATIALRIPEARADLRGMFGTLDGNPDNEIQLRDGTPVETPVTWEQMHTTYADSWRVSQAESLLYYGAGESTDTFTIPDFPGAPSGFEEIPEAGRVLAEAVCVSAGVSSTVSLQNCIVDVYCTGSDELAGDHFDNNGTRIPVSKPARLENWSIEGPGAASWQLFTGSANGEDDADYSGANLDPSFLVSDTEYSEVIVEWGTTNTADGSEGLVGLLFDYQGPMSANGNEPNDYDALLLAWSGTMPTAFSSTTAPTGWTLARLNGVIDAPDVVTHFYAQQSSLEYQVLATGYAPEFGWVNRYGHGGRIVYTADRIEVTTTDFVTFDEVMALAVEASTLGATFGAGRIGLFSLGNDTTRYRDVQVSRIR